MTRVAVVFPSANPERAAKAADAWHAQGYEVRLLVDRPDFPVIAADRILRVSVYQGYFASANTLVRDALADGVDICVVAGDDMAPDANHTAAELAAEYLEHFPSTFGLMQPTGDTLPCNSFCGSPWMGRAWIEWVNEGRGPYWPHYFQSHGDAEAQALAEKLEVLWQRPDLVHFHDHYVRRAGTEIQPYQAQNISKWWVRDEWLFFERQAAGFPGAWRAPVIPPPRAASMVRHHSNVKRGGHSEKPGWPAILNPKWGCLPPAAVQLRARERVLHLHGALPQALEARALRYLAGEYLTVDRTVVLKPDLPAAVSAAAELIKPTLVFVPLQGSVAPLTGADVAALRVACDPSCVIITWDREAHATPTPGCNWLDDLGAAVDANLTVTTAHTVLLTAHGIRRPGYWQVGCDVKPAAPARGVAPVVVVADYVPTQRRLNGMVQRLVKELPAVGLYGRDWRKVGIHRYAEVKPQALPGIYAAAQATIVMTNRTGLARYPGERLLPALACGAVVVAERFPDCEGLGLVDGVNCLLWRGWEELQRALAHAQWLDDEARQAMRDAAVEVARLHTWAVRASELQAIIDAVREDRR